jgi:hypothetical protein
MSTVQIQIDDESFKAPLVLSVVFHSLLFGALAVSTVISHAGGSWGGVGAGGSISVKLVGGLSGVPLPQPETVTTSRVVDSTKGLYKSEPKPKAPEPKTDAQQIPEFTKEKQPRYDTRPSKVLEDATPPPPNAVPYGQGGSPAVPYSQFSLGAGGATTGGLGFSGPGRAQPRRQQLAAEHSGSVGAFCAARRGHI